MSLTGRIETDVEIKGSADKFYEIFGCKPYKIPEANHDRIQSCELIDGEYGKVGCVVLWKYVHDGVPQVSKEKIEVLDDSNLSTTYSVVEGDILKAYKSCLITAKAMPKENGSVVHWTLEYEKVNEDIPELDPLLQFLAGMTKDIDAFVTKA